MGFFFFLILVVIGFLLFKFVMLLCNKNMQLWVKLDSVIQLVFSYLNFEIQFDCMFWAMHQLFCLFYFFLPALYFCILVSSSFSIQRMFFVFNCGPCFFTQICICVPGLHTVSERLLRFSSPNLLNFHGFFSVADHALYIMIEVPYCHIKCLYTRA